MKFDFKEVGVKILQVSVILLLAALVFILLDPVHNKVYAWFEKIDSSLLFFLWLLSIYILALIFTPIRKLLNIKVWPFTYFVYCLFTIFFFRYTNMGESLLQTVLILFGLNFFWFIVEFAIGENKEQVEEVS